MKLRHVWGGVYMPVKASYLSSKANMKVAGEERIAQMMPPVPFRRDDGELFTSISIADIWLFFDANDLIAVCAPGSLHMHEGTDKDLIAVISADLCVHTDDWKLVSAEELQNIALREAGQAIAAMVDERMGV
ncbi:MAG TPA: hypothetical protein VGK56_01280 [Anaerolineales bacterium]